MMNKDNKNDKIQKIVKKGLTLSLCAVLAGGLAAGSFEGVNRLTGWNEGTTVQAASNNENKLTYAKSEKKVTQPIAKMETMKRSNAVHKNFLCFFIIFSISARVFYASKHFCIFCCTASAF